MTRLDRPSQFDLVSFHNDLVDTARGYRKMPTQPSTVRVSAAAPEGNYISDLKHLVALDIRVRGLKCCNSIDSISEAIYHFLDAREVLTARCLGAHIQRHSIPNFPRDASQKGFLEREQITTVRNSVSKVVKTIKQRPRHSLLAKGGRHVVPVLLH
ncbi:hypothetical protein C5E05_19265 [Pseudoclavibacter sp. AY1H1]|nr:hypothetical protein C5E05_19265 [Pseudoclavibacter sp. AY1H1]